MSHVSFQLKEAQSHYDQGSSGLKRSAGNIILFQSFWTGWIKIVLICNVLSI